MTRCCRSPTNGVRSTSFYPPFGPSAKPSATCTPAARRRAVKPFHQKVARLRDRATELEIAINESLFNEARVIACTLAGSANSRTDR